MSTDPYCCFDIETAPIPDAEKFLGEFEAPATWKDPEKIAAWITEKKAKALEDAALSPILGRILVIGVSEAPDHCEFFEGPEDYLLLNFWSYYKAQREGAANRRQQWVGFNIKTFDLCRLRQRSWINKVKPARVFDDRGYMLDHFIDLRAVWCGGEYNGPGKLGEISRALGVGSKTGSGADFAKLYETDKPKALAYLKQDLILTRLVAGRIL